MPSSADLLLGKIAVKLQYLTEEELRQAIQAQSQKTPPPPLGEILIQQNLLTAEQLQQVLAIQKKKLETLDPRLKQKKEAGLFGRLVIKMGFASLEQVNECLRIQAVPQNEAKTLGEIMVEKGYLSPDQVRQVLAGQQKIHMRCPPCRLTFTVLTTTGGKGAKCPRCKGDLEEIAKKEPVAADAEFGTMIARAVDIHAVQRPVHELASTSKMVHAQCVICDEKFVGSPDETGRVRCPKCQSSFTPKRRKPS